MHAPRKFILSSLVSWLLFCAPPAWAVWDYSLGAKLAMYDALESVCKPWAPQEVARMLDQFQRTLSQDEKDQMESARTTDEYKEVFEGGRKEASEWFRSSPGKERELCVDLLSR
jgi:hypothetical protein